MSNGISARGTAITAFKKHLPQFESKEITTEEFRTRVLFDIADVLGILPHDCGYLFAKAVRAYKKDGSCTLDFGIARTHATPEHTSGAKNNQPNTDDDACYTILKIVDNCVEQTYSHASKEAAEMELAKRAKRAELYNEDWRLIKGLGPNPGDQYKLQNGEFEIS